MRAWPCWLSVLMTAGALTPGISAQTAVAAKPSYADQVQAQLAAAKRTEAETTLAGWQAAEPANPVPARILVSLEDEDGEPQKAIATAQAALDRTAAGGVKDEGLMYLLGHSQLRAGQTEAGAKTLAALLRTTSNPGLENDAAYELADHGLELPLADAASVKATERLEGLTQSWTMDEDLGQLRATTHAIQSTWDTLGWVRFREGKTESAEHYVRAGWLGNQTPDGARHLGELALAHGDKRGALEDFELSLALEPAVPADAAAVKALRQRVEDLRKAVPGHAGGIDQDAVLRKLRTLPLGAGGSGGEGEAEYKLLINAQGVLDARPTGAARSPSLQTKLERLKVSQYIPAGSPTHLVLVGKVTCRAGQCVFLLEP